MASIPKKIAFWKWILLYVITGAVDAIQIIIDLTGVGIAVSEALEAVMPIVLIGLLVFFKIPLLSHMSRLFSILGVDIGDSLTGGIAPFWILDVGYLHWSVHKEEKAMQAQQEQETFQNNVRQPLNSEGVRLARPPSNITSDTSRAANLNGVRAPGGGLKVALK